MFTKPGDEQKQFVQKQKQMQYVRKKVILAFYIPYFKLQHYITKSRWVIQ